MDLNLYSMPNLGSSKALHRLSVGKFCPKTEKLQTTVEIVCVYVMSEGHDDDDAIH